MQQKLALILTRARAKRGNQLSGVTSLVGRERGSRPGQVLYLHKAQSVLQPPPFSRGSTGGTSAPSKQATLCPSDYSKQKCGHKYDTLSST